MLTLVQMLVLPVVIARIFYLLFDQLYDVRYERKYLYVGSFFLWALFMAFVNILRVPFLNISFAVITINFMAFVLYKGEVKKRLVYTNLLIFIVFFCDTAAVAVWMILQNYSFHYVISNEISRLAVCLIEIMLLYFVYHILLHTFCRVSITRIQVKQMAFLIIIMCFEVLFVGIYALKSSNGDDGIVIIGILCCFLFFNMAFMGMLREISEMYQYKYELDLVKKQSELQFEHYQELSQKYQNSRKVIHDIKKHLSAMVELQSTDRERAERYCKNIGKQVEGLFQRFECSNRILSIVMSQKILLAESFDITVKTEIEDLLLEFMSDMDITAIFANLWDNAVEACKKVKTEERFISIEMQKKGAFLLICMKNSYNGNIRRDKKRIVSTKEQHEGMGLNIIKTTVEKYDGVFDVNDTEEFFLVRITIPLQEGKG